MAPSYPKKEKRKPPSRDPWINQKEHVVGNPVCLSFLFSSSPLLLFSLTSYLSTLFFFFFFFYLPNLPLFHFSSLARLPQPPGLPCIFKEEILYLLSLFNSPPTLFPLSPITVLFIFNNGEFLSALSRRCAKVFWRFGAIWFVPKPSPEG